MSIFSFRQRIRRNYWKSMPQQTENRWTKITMRTKQAFFPLELVPEKIPISSQGYHVLPFNPATHTICSKISKIQVAIPTIQADWKKNEQVHLPCWDICIIYIARSRFVQRLSELHHLMRLIQQMYVDFFL